MPFYPQTLRTLIAAKIGPQNVLPYFSQVLDGIEAAHFLGVWHRDLKPENILVDSTSSSVVIADFGIAHFVEDHLHTMVETKPATRLANFQYAAPEQKRVGALVDQRADIYALGLILNEMFTGDVIQGTSFRTIASTVPEWSYLDEIIDLMIRSLPEERPQRIDLVKQSLIASQNEFVSRQRLSSLSNKVIPRSQTDDPLVTDPLRILGVDADPKHLIFKLSGTPSILWQRVFQEIVGVQFYYGQSPKSVGFNEDNAWLPIGYPSQAQPLVDMFAKFLEKANRDYADRIHSKMLQEEAAERKKLDQQFAQETRRQEILGRIKL